jgi:hypothetical protein
MSANHEQDFTQQRMLDSKEKARKARQVTSGAGKALSSDCGVMSNLRTALIGLFESSGALGASRRHVADGILETPSRIGLCYH